MASPTLVLKGTAEELASPQAKKVRFRLVRRQQTTKTTIGGLLSLAVSFFCSLQHKLHE
jgi:hypothetical protein